MQSTHAGSLVSGLHPPGVAGQVERDRLARASDVRLEAAWDGLVRQMLKKVRILNVGSSDYLPGELALFASMRASRFFEMYEYLRGPNGARGYWRELAGRLLEHARRG